MRYAIVWAILWLTAAAGLAADVDPAVLKAENERVAVMARVKSNVLAIFSPDGAGGGSGVVITPDGYALTNFHVVQPCGNAMKCGMADGRLYDAVLVGLDPTGDVAMVKLFGRDDFPHATLGDSDQLHIGDWVIAMGNPFLLATDFQPTVTYGIVSGLHRYQYPAGTLLEYTDCIQTDASINPGNSGGPLFDSQGQLIGINGRASFEKRGRVNVGAAYAISINQVKNFMGSLRGGRVVDHATLGARVGFDEDNRVIVTDILQNSDAYRRGLRYGDELIAFGGRPIETPNAFKNVLGIYPKGWRVPLSFRRSGKRYDVLVRLASLHSDEELLDDSMKGTPEMPNPIPKPKRGSKPKAPGEPHPKRMPKGDEPPEKPEGRKLPAIFGHKPPAMPAVCKEHFAARRGFANYYFNRINRDRVWKSWTARADFHGLSGPWSIQGMTSSGTRVAFEIRETESVLKLPANEWRWSLGDPRSADSPPGSGGLLLALNLWRRLAVEGLDRFGDVTYIGTAPLAGQDGLVDVLSAIHAGVECRLMFHPADGHLLALEMYREDDTDPCELRFSDYREHDGRWLPQLLEVRLGDDLFETFKLDAFDFGKPNTDQAKQP
jgi:S1-C subfamily serine protease